MYKVLTPLRKDGKRIEIGEAVELDAKDAAELLAIGAVEEIPAASSKSKKAAE